jgi:ketosteroid isomerase-like protein
MSKENIELHFRSFDALNRRDLSALLALMDDDVEAFSRLVPMEGGLHGHDGMRRWWKGWFDAFPDYTVEVLEVRDFGDVTVAAVRAAGHGAESEVPLEDRFWHATGWRRGKCVWWRIFYTWDEAVETLRLSEQEAHAES